MLGTETVEFNAADYDKVVAGLVERQGGGVPRIESAALTLAASKSEPPMGPAPKSDPVAVKLQVGEHDVVGELRSKLDYEAAKEAGFAPALPIYRRGTRATGSETHRAEFNALPEAAEGCAALIQEVQDENRRDVVVPAGELRMDKGGKLVLPDARHMPLARQAMGGLAERLGAPAGASGYLSGVWPELRAINVNRLAVAKAEYDAAGSEPTTAMLRTRASGVGREVFGIVSEGYAPFDADKIAEAIQLAVPAGARADVLYDGFRSRFDVLFMTDVSPDEVVAGEYFKAGVRVRSSDIGGGSVAVSAMIWQNLCLNFIILDVAKQEVARLRHFGSVEALAERFSKAFDTALGKIDHFTAAWGYAQKDNVVATVEEAKGLSIAEVLPGLFNGLIERDLVPVPKRSRKAVVGDLTRMYGLDTSAAVVGRDYISRAGIVNAVTRYAHEVNSDPWVEHEIEEAAGRLVLPARGKLAPLPYLALPA